MEGGKRKDSREEGGDDDMTPFMIGRDLLLFCFSFINSRVL